MGSASSLPDLREGPFFFLPCLAKATECCGQSSVHFKLQLGVRSGWCAKTKRDDLCAPEFQSGIILSRFL